MEHGIVSLDAPGTDWAGLVRFVERSGQPLWLEAEGEIRGVLLPTGQARRLMGRWSVQRSTHGAAYASEAGGTSQQDARCAFDDLPARP